MSSAQGKVMAGSTVAQFEFASELPVTADYVEVTVPSSDGGPAVVVARVVASATSNPYFSDRQVVHYLGAAEESYAAYTTFLTTAQPVATMRQGCVERPRVPVRPGMDVRAASAETVSTVLGTSANGLRVGRTRSTPPVDILVDPQGLLRTHVGVVGHTGAGKSWLTRAVLSRLVRAGEVDVAVLDPTGEYEPLAEAHGGLLVSMRQLTYPRVAAYIRGAYDLTGPQTQWVEALLGQSQQRQLGLADETEDPPATADTITSRKLAERAAASTGRTGDLAHKLRSLDITFAAHPTPVWTSARLHVFSGTSCGQDEFDFAASHVLRQLLDRRRTHASRPMVVVIEEAHILAPSQTGSRSRQCIVTIAREGRKQGIALWLVSQRPRHVDPTVLSQCGTLFMFRLQNSDDVRHVLEFSPFATFDVAAELPALWVGECIVMGDALNVPAICKVAAPE